MLKNDKIYIFDAKELSHLRAQFPLLQDKTHLGSCSQSPLSYAVKDAMDCYLNTLTSGGMAWPVWIRKVNDAKAVFARLINADVDEIAVASSVSEAMATFVNALDFSKRSKIVTTSLDFPSNHYIWMANKRNGAELHTIHHNKDYMITMTDYKNAVDVHTNALTIAYVSYLNGFKQDLEALTKLAHDKGALCIVDAYQGLGTDHIDVKALDVDMLVSGNLKFLLGIPGIAFMYVKKELADQLKPTVTGWMGQENPFDFQIEKNLIAGGTRKFETGTPPIINAYAAEAGMKIIEQVGIGKIKSQIDKLSEVALLACKDYGFKTISPSMIAAKGSNTALVFSDDQEAHAIESALAERKIIVSARGNLIRIAPHFFNTPEEIISVFENIVEVKEKLL